MVAADHLQVPRNHGLFKHHGIDLGDGTIAHYLEGREIIRSTIKEFAQGHSCEIIYYEFCSPKRATLTRAIQRIGEQNYNLLFNNCEHFANWCKTGIHRSKQIENLLNSNKIGILIGSRIIPSTLKILIKSLINNDIVDKNLVNKAINNLNIITNLHSQLTMNLDNILKQINISERKGSNAVDSTLQPNEMSNLVIQAQTIADEIMALENLNTQINDLLNKSKS